MRLSYPVALSSLVFLSLSEIIFVSADGKPPAPAELESDFSEDPSDESLQTYVSGLGVGSDLKTDEGSPCFEPARRWCNHVLDVNEM